jgi:hypothetical protein
MELVLVFVAVIGSILAIGEIFLRSATRRTDRALAVAIARENARTAIGTAVHILQPLVQRGCYVTVTAANAIGAEKNGEWLGLWSVEDGRISFVRWLISGEMAQNPSAPLADCGETVPMLGDCFLELRCPIEEIRDGERCLGRMAFWVDDENGKICVTAPVPARITGRTVQDLAAGWRQSFPASEVPKAGPFSDWLCQHREIPPNVSIGLPEKVGVCYKIPPANH